MRDSLFKHQAIEYPPGQPFWVGVATQRHADHIYVRSSHWHEELEIAYTQSGHAFHYIDGQRIEATPGALIVTNCECVHHIQPCPEDIPHYGAASTVVLLVNRRYLEGVFPALQSYRFTNDQVQASGELRGIMEKFAAYSERETHAPHEVLFMQSLLLRMIADLLENRSVKYGLGARQNTKAETFKAILQYVRDHYREPITQSEMAKMFYFTPQYFSRLFKHCAGRTFSEHLAAVRLEQARMELLYSDRLVREIARENGFSDDKSFIRAFKKAYDATPLQYKKQMRGASVSGEMEKDN